MVQGTRSDQVWRLRGIGNLAERDARINVIPTRYLLVSGLLPLLQAVCRTGNRHPEQFMATEPLQRPPTGLGLDGNFTNPAYGPGGINPPAKTVEVLGEISGSLG
jgi:hypothetical protein